MPPRVSAGTKTYALLIYRNGTGEPAPERAEEALVGHRAVQKEASARGELHAVAKLDPAAKAKTVSAHDITDGPYVETKEWLVGFYLLDCVSEEAALARAQQLCPTDDHAIEVRPVSWRWRR